MNRRQIRPKTTAELAREHDQACAEAPRVRVRTKPARSGVVIGEGRPCVQRDLGCHPKQVNRFNKLLKEAGVPCYHRADGALLTFSRRGRALAAKHYGTIDQDGGYGDCTD